MRLLNASVLERKSLNRNLSWGFPLSNLLPKTRVLKHRVLERKRRPNANASVLGTQRFSTLSALLPSQRFATMVVNYMLGVGGSPSFAASHLDVSQGPLGEQPFSL